MRLSCECPTAIIARPARGPARPEVIVLTWSRVWSSWQGFKSEIARFLGRALTIVVLANLAPARPERFTDGLAALVDPAFAKAGSP